jgi:hypothetical protein
LGETDPRTIDFLGTGCGCLDLIGQMFLAGTVADCDSKIPGHQPLRKFGEVSGGPALERSPSARSRVQDDGTVSLACRLIEDGKHRS